MLLPSCTNVTAIGLARGADWHVVENLPSCAVLTFEEVATHVVDSLSRFIQICINSLLNIRKREWYVKKKKTIDDHQINYVSLKWLVEEFNSLRRFQPRNCLRHDFWPRLPNNRHPKTKVSNERIKDFCENRFHFGHRLACPTLDTGQARNDNSRNRPSLMSVCL